jgi:hypothetical protein
MAASIENAPLRRIGFQPVAIVRELLEPEVFDAALDPPADLAAHLAKTGPAQLQTRQRPLQKGDALGVTHDRDGAQSAAREQARRTDKRKPAPDQP